MGIFMKRNSKFRNLLIPITLIVVLISACNKQPVPKPEGQISTPSPFKNVISIDFNNEKEGLEPESFAALVDTWVISREDNNKVLKLDGTKWHGDIDAPNLEDKTKAIFGTVNTAFLNAVKNYPSYPLAVAKTVQDFHQGEISVRFKPISGTLDQAAGIAFNIQPNGDYLALRANALEDNLDLYSYQAGARSLVQREYGIPTPTGKWHDLKLVVNGDQIQGYIDGKLYLTNKGSGHITGKVGLWSKSDSEILFDDFTVKTP